MTATVPRIFIDAEAFIRLRKQVEVCCEFANGCGIVQQDGFRYGTEDWWIMRTLGKHEPGGRVVAESLATGDVAEFVLE